MGGTGGKKGSRRFSREGEEGGPLRKRQPDKIRRLEKERRVKFKRGGRGK